MVDIDANVSVALDPHSVIWVLVASFIIALFLAIGVGANDVANSFGTSVGSKVLTLRNACILASIFEILGAISLGYKVSSTIRTGMIYVDQYDEELKLLMLGFLAALIGSAVWNLLATVLGLPISGTHSIVGAIIGFSVVAKGFASVKWHGLISIVASWFISPVLSGVVSLVLYLFIKHYIILSDNSLERGLKVLPYFYGISIAINIFSIVHEGPHIFKKITLGYAFLIAISFGVVIAAGVWFIVVPRLRAKILKILNAAGNTNTGAVITDGDTASNNNKFFDAKSGVEGGGAGGAIRSNSFELQTQQQRSSSSKSSKKNNNLDSSINSNNSTTSNSSKVVENGSIKSNSRSIKTASYHEAIKNGDLMNGGSGGVVNPTFDNATEKTIDNPTVGGGKKPAAATATKTEKSFTTDDDDLEMAAMTNFNDEDKPEVAELFRFLQILTACFGGFAHGGNDVSNAIGPLVAVMLIWKTSTVNGETPWYVLLYGGIGITIGLWVLGRKVIKTMGEDLTKITPSTGFTIEIGASMTVLFASKLGFPISTTHCKVGSVVTIGKARDSSEGVNWRLFVSIAMAWILTVPVTALLSGAAMALLKFSL